MSNGDRLLEQQLADLDLVALFPPTPLIAASVVDELRSAPARPAPGARRPAWPAVLLLVVLLLLAAIAAVVVSTGGIRLTFLAPAASPPVATSPRPGEGALGTRVTLDDARARAGFALHVPQLPELGSPDRVYLLSRATGALVSFVYDARAGYERLIVGELAADIGADSFEKMILGGTRVEVVQVNGRSGWWVAGGEHFFVYRDPGGRRVETTLRLAGDTLIWEEDGITFRVEAAPDLGAALRVAGSLR